MPTDQCEAIVLRTYNFADQDKIAVLFSREKGVLRGVAKGARKFGNRFGSSLEPMSRVRAFLYEKERKDLVTISNCDLLESFFDIQKDLRVAFTLSYFAELIEEFFPARTRDEVLFRLLLSVLRCLGSGGDLPFLTRYFEAWFLRTTGLLPDLARCRACRKPLADRSWLSPKRDGAYCAACAPSKKDEVPPDTAAFLDWVRKNPPPESCPLPFQIGNPAGLRNVLQALIVFHLEKEPRTLRHLKELGIETG
jgi:DNA repair protein RecO (recombination protein O)